MGGREGREEGGHLEEMAMSSGAVFSLCGGLWDGAAESVTVRFFSARPPLFTRAHAAMRAGRGAHASTYWGGDTLVFGS